jgi:hypothetical protein
MKRAEVRTKADAYLKMTGFTPDDYTWAGAELILFAGGRPQKIRMQSGITARDFSFRLGIITGIAWANDIKPARYRPRSSEAGQREGVASENLTIAPTGIGRSGRKPLPQLSL